MFSFNERSIILFTKRELWLHRAYTDWHDCVVLEIGNVSSDVVELSTSKGYDQAPVYSPEDERIFGIISTERVKFLLETKSPLTLEDEEIEWETVRSETTLEELLETLSTSRAALVVEGDFVDGMITISDLNSHAFRSLLYHPLGELEAKLAKIVEDYFVNPWDWLCLLSDQHQVTLIGHWELAKRNGVDVGPINSTYLSQLLTVVGKTEALRKLFGYTSRKQFENATGSFSELRNRVMHPIRPLILNFEDVARLKQTITEVSELEVRATEILASRQSTSSKNPHIGVEERDA